MERFDGSASLPHGTIPASTRRPREPPGWICSQFSTASQKRARSRGAPDYWPEPLKQIRAGDSEASGHAG